MARTAKISFGFIKDDWRREFNVEVGAGQTLDIDEDIPDGSIDLPLALSAGVSQIAGLFLVADRDLTLKTNGGNVPGDGGVPGDTIKFQAGKPLVWYPGYQNCPFSADIAAATVTNASGADGKLEGFIAVKQKLAVKKPASGTGSASARKKG